MARYIDADKLIETLRADCDREGENAYEMAKKGLADASVKYGHGQFCYLNAMERVKDTPTADVAPKSEVAREIFEEIGNRLIFNTYGIATISNKIFAELKKKYTEGENGT